MHKFAVYYTADAITHQCNSSKTQNDTFKPGPEKQLWRVGVGSVDPLNRTN